MWTERVQRSLAVKISFLVGISIACTGCEMAATVLCAEKITMGYVMGDVEVPALQGVDLDLVSSELVALLGASGSGTSTLLNKVLDVQTGKVVLTAIERSIVSRHNDSRDHAQRSDKRDG